MGGELEDQGSALTGSGRFYRHFHDPLRSWDLAGLTFRGPNESSVRWMQNRDQESTGAAGGNWSWHDARRMYYQSLTEPDPRRREALLAATFRALGQIMHLVVDASNPDHARNDPHGLPSAPFIGGLFWNYDKWVLSRHTGANAGNPFIPGLLANSIGFDPAILRQAAPAGEQAATVPIARLIDTDAYNGSNPSVTFNAASPSAPAAIGIAEITNANFFSEDTLTGPYPFPRAGTEGLIRSELLLPRRTPDDRHIVRRYWTRPDGQGLLPANPLRAECAGDLNPRGVPARPYPCVDGVVWDQVAAHMLPRAVGYARGVLDYFFRGSLRVINVGAPADGLFIVIQNTSDEAMEGIVEVYARRQKGSPAEQRQRVSVLNEGRPITLGPGGSALFPLQISPGAATAYHVLVFRGRRGLEQDAVVGQVFAVPDVQIVQQSYDADISKTCTTQIFEVSGFGGAFGERLQCTWKPINHRIEGRIVTNFAGGDPTDPTDHAIDRIEAFWFGSAGGPAPLTLDGTVYPSGVWTRGEGDTDPDSFLILDPAARGNSRLVLIVYLRDGNVDEFTTQLATFAETLAVYDKTASFRPFSNDWQVTAGRSWRVTPLMRLSFFRPVSIGGFPAFPVSTFKDTGREFLRVTSLGGVHAVTDVSETFTSREAAAARLAAITLEARFPEPPDLHWSAVVKSLPLLPGALQFWQAFVANGDPPPVTFTMTGHKAGAP